MRGGCPRRGWRVAMVVEQSDAQVAHARSRDDRSSHLPEQVSGSVSVVGAGS